MLKAQSQVISSPYQTETLEHSCLSSMLRISYCCWLHWKCIL